VTHTMSMYVSKDDMIAALEAENAKLRAALEEMFAPEDGKPTNWKLDRQQCADLARLELEK